MSSAFTIKNLGAQKSSLAIASDDDEDDNSDLPQFDDQTVSFASFNKLIGIPVDAKPIVMADLNDGYGLRQLYDYLKFCVPVAPMFFHEDGIDIERSNTSGTLYTKCVISRDDLVKYHFDPKRCNDPNHMVPDLNCSINNPDIPVCINEDHDENGKGCQINQPRHILSFVLADLMAHIKPLAKKESLRLFHYAEEPRYIHGQLYGGNKISSQSTIRVLITKYEHKVYNIPNISADIRPNQVVPLSSFCNSCTNIVRSKSSSCKFEIYPNGVRIVATNNTGLVSRTDPWGDCSDQMIKPKKNLKEPDEIVSVKPFITHVNKDDIKALTKMNNFHPSGIVRIYSNSNEFTVLKVKLGAFGVCTSILKNKDSEIASAKGSNN